MKNSVFTMTVTLSVTATGHVFKGCVIVSRCVTVFSRTHMRTRARVQGDTRPSLFLILPPYILYQYYYDNYDNSSKASNGEAFRCHGKGDTL